MRDLPTDILRFTHKSQSKILKTLFKQSVSNLKHFFVINFFILSKLVYKDFVLSNEFTNYSF